MKRAWGWVALAAMGSTLVACPFKKFAPVDAGDDAGPQPSASAAPEAPTGGPVNASEMTRYPDEKPSDHAPLTAESGGNMRTQAGAGGDLVMILKRGTEVEKVAEHAGYYLIVADDPKEPRKLMGWIAESAFSAEGPRREYAEHDGGGGRPTVDAGAKPGPLRPLDIHKNANGSCAAGYAPCAALCRATCKAPSDCGPVPQVRCTGGFCLGPGAEVCK